MQNLYDYVNVGTKIRRSHLPQVSYECICDCDFGDAVPVMARFAVPGDIWKITNTAFIRTLPLFAPQFTGIKIKFRNFFVPLRLVDEDAVEIIKGGDNGETNKVFASVTITPKKYGFYDYLGTSLIKNDPSNEGAMAAYWLRGYRLIRNEWYRDEFLQDEIDIYEEDDTLFKVNYQRDYFTSALLTQQLGIAPAIPLTGVLPLSYSGGYVGNLKDINGDSTDDKYGFIGLVGSNAVSRYDTTREKYSFPAQSLAYVRPSSVSPESKSINTFGNIVTVGDSGSSYSTLGAYAQLDGNYNSSVFSSNLAAAGGQFDVQDLRRAFAFQSILERNNRAGSRYNEFLRANFGISPTDETLQRPVYLGGSQSYINVSEVLQQSQTTESSPLGTQGGKGIGLTSGSLKPYLVKEFGMMFTIMSITPDTMYNSQGINRQYTYKSRWDFFNPSLQNLGEQAIRNSELYVSNDGDNDKIFGYQPMYQELRTSENVVAGAFRDTLNYWHLARNFSERPNLNSDFIEVDSARDSLTRIFNATDSQQYKPFYCHVYNNLSAVRPLVKYPIPATL